MAILLCAATRFEIASTIELLQSGNLLSKEPVDILITGVGLLPAAYHLTKYILQQKPSLIVQCGVGGSFDEHLSLGDVVAIKSDTIGDSGVMENGEFKSLFDLDLVQLHEAPWQTGKLHNPYFQLLQSCKLPAVNAVTVNEITTDSNRINFYKKKWDVTIESLEGAALHYIALLETIPFLQLRSVSNYTGERHKENWKLKEAIQNLNNELQRVLINL